MRQDPPSLEEQQRDVIRQQEIKRLAQLADERWRSKPSYLDKPQTRQSAPATRTSDATFNPAEQSANTSRPAARPGVHNAIEGQAESNDRTKGVPTGPSEQWQPESWTPMSRR